MKKNAIIGSFYVMTFIDNDIWGQLSVWFDTYEEANNFKNKKNTKKHFPDAFIACTFVEEEVK